MPTEIFRLIAYDGLNRESIVAPEKDKGLIKLVTDAIIGQLK